MEDEIKLYKSGKWSFTPPDTLTCYCVNGEVTISMSEMKRVIKRAERLSHLQKEVT